MVRHALVSRDCFVSRPRESDIIPAYDISLFSWCWLPLIFYLAYQRSWAWMVSRCHIRCARLAGRRELLRTLPRLTGWSNTKKLIALTRGDCEIDRTQHSRRDVYFRRLGHESCLTTISLTAPLDFELAGRHPSTARMSETSPYHTRGQKTQHSSTVPRQHLLLSSSTHVYKGRSILCSLGTMPASTLTRLFAVTGKPPKWVSLQPWRPFIQ